VSDGEGTIAGDAVYQHEIGRLRAEIAALRSTVDDLTRSAASIVERFCDHTKIPDDDSQQWQVLEGALMRARARTVK